METGCQRQAPKGSCAQRSQRKENLSKYQTLSDTKDQVSDLPHRQASEAPNSPSAVKSCQTPNAGRKILSKTIKDGRNGCPIANTTGCQTPASGFEEVLHGKSGEGHPSRKSFPMGREGVQRDTKESLSPSQTNGASCKGQSTLISIESPRSSTPCNSEL